MAVIKLNLEAKEKITVDKKLLKERYDLSDDASDEPDEKKKAVIYTKINEFDRAHPEILQYIKSNKSGIELSNIYGEAKSKRTLSELKEMVQKNNKEHGTDFEIRGAYGQHELWANGKDRIEAGSLNDIYESFVKNRFKEKYTKEARSEEYNIPGTNLYIRGFTRDRNGNSLIKVGTPNERSRSLQTMDVFDGNPPHGYWWETDPRSTEWANKMVVDYVRKHMKGMRFKEYGSKMEGREDMIRKEALEELEGYDFDANEAADMVVRDVRRGYDFKDAIKMAREFFGEPVRKSRTEAKTEKWMQDAFSKKTKGKLHERLGISKDKKIPDNKLKAIENAEIGSSAAGLEKITAHDKKMAGLALRGRNESRYPGIEELDTQEYDRISQRGRQERGPWGSSHRRDVSRKNISEIDARQEARKYEKHNAENGYFINTNHQMRDQRIKERREKELKLKEQSRKESVSDDDYILELESEDGYPLFFQKIDSTHVRWGHSKDKINQVANMGEFDEPIYHKLDMFLHPGEYEEARGGEVDKVAARELALSIENDGELYRSQAQPIMLNLARKMKRGIYNPELAIKLWMYLVEAGAKKYAKDFGSRGDNWFDMFNKATREEAARQLAEGYEEEIEDKLKELGGKKERVESKKYHTESVRQQVTVQNILNKIFEITGIVFLETRIDFNNDVKFIGAISRVQSTSWRKFITSDKRFILFIDDCNAFNYKLIAYGHIAEGASEDDFESDWNVIQKKMGNDMFNRSEIRVPHDKEKIMKEGELERGKLTPRK
jgi:hypothetical protein